METSHNNGNVFNRYLIWLVLIQMLGSMAYYGYVPLIPFIEQEFLLNKSQIGWMTSAVFLGSSFIAIPSGFITDKIGASHTLFIFCLLLVLVTFSFILSNSYCIILLLLFFLGTGYGGITPGTNKSIMEIFPSYNRGTAMGIKQMGVPLGSTLGTILLPSLGSYLSWRQSFLFITFLIIVICFFHFKVLPNQIQYENQEKTNWLESIREVLSNKKFLKILAVIVFFIWVQLSVLTYLVLYLNEAIHISLSISLLCLALLQIGGVIGRAGWGVVSDKFSNHKRGPVLALIGVSSGLFVLLLGIFNEFVPIIIVIFVSFILGITTQGWNGIFVIMISEVVKHHQIGLASGMGLAVVYVGAIFGTPFSGWIIDSTGSYKIMWGISGVMMVLIGLFTYYLNFDQMKMIKKQ